MLPITNCLAYLQGDHMRIEVEYFKQVVDGLQAELPNIPRLTLITELLDSELAVTDLYIHEIAYIFKVSNNRIKIIIDQLIGRYQEVKDSQGNLIKLKKTRRGKLERNTPRQYYNIKDSLQNLIKEQEHELVQ